MSSVSETQDPSPSPGADGKLPGVSLEVGIVVRDLESVTPFYRDGLGLVHLTDREIPPGIQRRFQCGGGILKMLQPKEPPTGSNPNDGFDNTTGLRWFTLSVKDIEQVIERCVTLGGRVVHPLTNWKGTKVVMVEDPAGSCWIELFERGYEAIGEQEAGQP
jgi:predicted enzyme related to lactoylglutathione lyase